MKDEIISDEVVLPRRVKPQPVPFFASCGDCSYCCIAGALDISVEQAYVLAEKMKRDENGNPVCQGVSWHEFVTNLNTIYYKHNYFDRILTDTPIWFNAIHVGHMDWGFPAHHFWTEWSRYVLMAIDAGYYGFCSVIMRPEDKKFNGWTDHKVMICGWRKVTKNQYDDNGEYVCGNVNYEVLVSCSSRITPDEEWVSIQTFLKEWGGFNIVFARPKNR